MKGQAINLIEENVLYHLCDIGVGKDFLSKIKKKKTLYYKEFDHSFLKKDFS